MQHRSILVRWAGLFAILLVLGMPAFTAGVSANPVPPVAEMASVTQGDESPSPQPTISITGTASAARGETLAYTITVRNEGTGPLTGGSFALWLPVALQGTWTLTPDSTGTCEPVGTTRGACSGIEIAPGAAATFTLQVQTATSLACAPFVPFVELADPYAGESSFSTTITCHPELSISMSGPASAAPGETVEFPISVTNSGDVVISDVRVEDAGTALLCPVGDLAVGETVACSAFADVTEADVLAGEMTYTAIVAGSAPNGDAVSANASATVAIDVPTASLDLSTDITTPADGAREGAELEIAFTVTNSGDVTLRDVELTSDLDGLQWSGDRVAATNLVFLRQVSTGGAIGDLAAGESVTIRGTYVVTRADAEAGSLRFSSVASGSTAEGELVRSAEEEVILEVARPQADTTPAAPDPTATPVATGTPAVTKLPATGSGQGGAESAPWLMGLTLAGSLAMIAGLRVRSTTR